MIILFLFFSFCFFYPQDPEKTRALNLLSSTSQINLKNNSVLELATPLNLQGSLNMATGSSVTGDVISFSGSNIFRNDNIGILVKGNFSVDASATSIDNVQINKNPTTFNDGTYIDLLTTTDLQSVWNFYGKVVINGNGNALKITDPSAQLIFNPGACVFFTDINVQGIEISKFTIVDNTVEIKLSQATFQIVSDSTFTNGAFIIKGNSEFILDNSDVIFADPSTFVLEGGGLSIENRNNPDPPVFGTLDSFGVFTSLIDNAFVKQATDQSQISDPGVTILTGGVATGTINIDSNSNIDPGQQIVFNNNNVVVNGNGSSLTFADTDDPQIVVPAGITATFENINLLRIRQSTFQLEPDSKVVFKDRVTLEYIEDVSYSQGTFAILGNDSTVFARGIGGRKKITLTTDGTNTGTFDIGANQLILEDVEIDGFENVISREIGGVSGKVYLAGGSRINISQDLVTDVVVRGDNNYLALQKNNLTILSKIRLQNDYDSTLSIGFSTTQENRDLVINLGAGSLASTATGGEATIRFINDKVNVVNLDPYSFVINQRTVLEGQRIIVFGNPIRQETTLFSLGANTVLESTTLPNPIEIIFASLSGLSQDELFFTVQDSPFVSTELKNLKISRPQMTVKKTIVGNNLRGAILMEQGSVIKSFKPHETEKLELIMTGNSTVETKIREQDRFSQSDDDILIASQDDDNLDKFKTIDKIYVTGTGNKIVASGYIDFKSKLFLDEQSDLTVEFSDATSATKSFRFETSYGPFPLSLPKSSSLIFKGKGTVFFDHRSQINFQGDNPTTLSEVEADIFLDNRPSLIFDDYSTLVVSQSSIINLIGKGKLIFKNNSSLKILNGKMILGNSAQDFFNLIFEKQSFLKIGDNLSSSFTPTSRPSRLSLSQGSFEILFDHKSECFVGNGGIFEIGLLNAVYTSPVLSMFKFDSDSLLSLQNQGMLGFGQSDITDGTNSTYQALWNNLNGTVLGDGTVALFTSSGTTPFLQVQLQSQFFQDDQISAFDIVKRLGRITSELILAHDFVDASDGLTKLITSQNIIVTLDDGDVIRQEGPNSGNVYGTTSGDRRFYVSPAGEKVFV